MNRDEAERKILKEAHPVARDAFLDFFRSMADEPDLSYVRPHTIHRTPIEQSAVAKAGFSKVGAWRSVHQYGCAIDFVPCPAGKWTWEFAHWERLHGRAQRFGLHAPIKWDRPHIVLIGWNQAIRAWLASNAFT